MLTDNLQNVEYARTLLLKLEHDVTNIKIQSQKQRLITDLQTKRDLIKQLNHQLIEMDQLDTGLEEEDTEEEVRPAEQATKEEHENKDNNANSTQQAQEPSNTLRSRNTQPNSTTSKATTTSSSALFSPPKEKSDIPSLQTRESHLAAQEKEQDTIKTSLLSLAQALKQSNLDFSQSLEEEKDVLDRAVKGLDKNALGLEGAERKMGTLRKMTEGQGWWGRVKLYALIAALWIAAFLLVFVGPKLRF